MTHQQNLCPQCGRQMYFGGNGRSLQCEVCGYTQTIEKDIPTPVEIATSLKFMAQFNQSRADSPGSQGARLLLLQGIEAAKEGNTADAYYFLEWTRAPTPPTSSAPKSGSGSARSTPTSKTGAFVWNTPWPTSP